MSNVKSEQYLTPVFRVSFPSVFEPSGMGNAEKKYSLTMLFDKAAQATPEYAKIKAAIRAAVHKQFPDPAKRPSGLRSPLRNGSEKPDTDGYKDCTFAAARSKTKPGLIDRNSQPILGADEFYAGCYARAFITVYYYDNSGNKGVGFGLQNIQKVKDGDAFSGRARAEDQFSSAPALADDEAANSTAAPAGAVPANDDLFA